MSIYTVASGLGESFRAWHRPRRQQCVQFRILQRIYLARSSGGSSTHRDRTRRRSCGIACRAASPQEGACTCPSLPWRFARSWPCPDAPRPLRTSESDRRQIRPDAPEVGYRGNHQDEYLSASPIRRESLFPPHAARSCRWHGYSVERP